MDHIIQSNATSACYHNGWLSAEKREGVCRNARPSASTSQGVKIMLLRRKHLGAPAAAVLHLAGYILYS